MSLGARLSLVKRLVSELRKWPEDGNKLYKVSLRNFELEKYETYLTNSSTKGLGSSTFLESQITAVSKIRNNESKQRFPLSERIIQPNGLPNYYERIVKEANKTAKKASIFQALKETTFGWFKR